MRKPSAWWIAVAVLIVGLGSGVSGVGQPGQIDKQGEALLQAAKNTELVKGDLKSAIEQYKTILARKDVGRTVAAKALLEMGLCYEKLGQTDARAAYEQLLRQYGDQAEQVQAARARLAALGGAPGQSGSAEMTIRRVWSGAGVDITGAPSPDGKYLSIMDPESGDLAIWEIATGQKRRVTNKGSWSTSEMVLGSTWSPDGKKVAYAWMAKDVVPELRIIGRDGTEPRTLSPVAWPLDWSPDGKFLLALVPRDNSNSSAVLALVSVTSGAVTTLGTPENPIFSWSASYSADGKYIVCDLPQQAGAAERDVFIISVDGKQAIPLVKHAADDRLLGWMTDSDTVLFASNRTGTRDAWALRVVDGTPQGDPVLVRKDIGQMAPMGFSDRGSFYYNTAVSVVDVFEGSLDLARGTMVEPPKKIVQRVDGTSYSPEWSPDGKYLAYVAERRPSAPLSAYRLCIRTAQTGEEREIPLAVDSFWKMHWSADSSAVFATMGGQTSQGLFRIDLQTGRQALLARSGWSDSLIKDFAVSPDGKSVYYAHFQWQKKLVTVIRHSLETGQETEVYRKAAAPDISALTVSPDGTSVSFSTADELSNPAGFVIRVLPTAGGPTRDLLQGTLEMFTPHAWTPDGKTILFIKRTGMGTKDEKRELWQVASAGGEPRKINVGMELRDIKLHPDGRRIVFTSGTTSKEVWVMENFLPANKGGK